MEEPCIIFPHKKGPNGKPPENPLKKERGRVYSNFKSKFNKMTNSVINSHNETDFARITDFLDEESKSEFPQELLPTCLLVNRILSAYKNS